MEYVCVRSYATATMTQLYAVRISLTVYTMFIRGLGSVWYLGQSRMEYVCVPNTKSKCKYFNRGKYACVIRSFCPHSSIYSMERVKNVLSAVNATKKDVIVAISGLTDLFWEETATANLLL